jgi:tetratricopeptide (TPR) repeat protein
LMQGDSENALGLCPEMEEIAREAGDAALLALTEHNAGMARFMLGDFDGAIAGFDLALEHRERASAAEILRFHAADIRVVDVAMRCWAACLSIENTPALRSELDRAVAAARAEVHEFSRCFALNILAAAHQLLREAATVLDLVEAAIAISQQKKFAYWDAWSSILRGWAWARSGDPARGIPELRAGLDAYLAIGANQIELYAKTLLADAYLSAGEIERGLAEIEEVRIRQDAVAVRYHRTITDQVERDLVRARDAGR